MTSTWRASAAEFLGTFALVFMGAGSIIMDAHTGGGIGVVGIALGASLGAVAYTALFLRGDGEATQQ